VFVPEVIVGAIRGFPNRSNVPDQAWSGPAMTHRTTAIGQLRFAAPVLRVSERQVSYWEAGRASLAASNL
jgi:hypothetical protein